MAGDGDPLTYRAPEEQQGFELIGAAVRRRRQYLRLTQTELARRARIHQSVISRIERGTRWGIGSRRFARLVHVLGGLDFEPPGARPAVRLDTPIPNWRRETEEEYISAVAAAREEEESDIPDSGLEGV